MQNPVHHTDHFTTDTSTQNHFLVAPILSAAERFQESQKKSVPWSILIILNLNIPKSLLKNIPIIY